MEKRLVLVVLALLLPFEIELFLAESFLATFLQDFFIFLLALLLWCFTIAPFFVGSFLRFFLEPCDDLTHSFLIFLLSSPFPIKCPLSWTSDPLLKKRMDGILSSVLLAIVYALLNESSVSILVCWCRGSIWDDSFVFAPLVFSFVAEFTQRMSYSILTLNSHGPTSGVGLCDNMPHVPKTRIIKQVFAASVCLPPSLFLHFFFKKSPHKLW